MPNATTRRPLTLPPNAIHQYPTMPSKKSKQPPRKPPPEQIVQMPLAIYPPPGHHPSDSTILGFHRGPSSSDTSSKSTANVRTRSLVARSILTSPQQLRGRSAGPSKSTTYAIFTQPNSIASTSSLTSSSMFAPSPSDKRIDLMTVRDQVPFAVSLNGGRPLLLSMMTTSPPWQRRANQHSATPGKTILHMRLPMRCARPYGPKTLLL
jgi:hypothetical protein